ncbi:MAG: DUF1289 domain-containing protein [Sphingomonas sp.]
MAGFIEIVPMQAIASPCVNVCEIDRPLGQCRGCRRTLDEIARWTLMTSDERNAVMADLPGRRR